MLILPDRTIAPPPRFLVPIKERAWRTPSLAQPKDQFGNENVTRFRLVARCHDGAARWVGWFDDRSEADAFLYAIFTGSILYERELWRLPTPWWDSDFADALYDFAVVSFLSSPTGSLQTWTSPIDYVTTGSSIQCLGGGGSGGAGADTGSTSNSTGGGGAAFSKITNFSVATPGTTTASYQIAAGGASVNRSPKASASGNVGGSTWFNNATDPGVGSDNSKCSAAGGGGGAGNTTSGAINGGTAGAAASSWGTTKFDGGRGGNKATAVSGGATGGGGAGGPTAAGNQGVDAATGVTTNGGSADNGGTGAGAAGTTNGGNGGDGTEFDGSHGCGGGGAGNKSNAGSNTAGSGGNYGGGGAGSTVTTSGTATSGTGKQGLIVVTYTPHNLFKPDSMNGMGVGGPFRADPMSYSKGRKQ